MTDRPFFFFLRLFLETDFPPCNFSPKFPGKSPLPPPLARSDQRPFFSTRSCPGFLLFFFFFYRVECHNHRILPFFFCGFSTPLFFYGIFVRFVYNCPDGHIGFLLVSLFFLSLSLGGHPLYDSVFFPLFSTFRPRFFFPTNARTLTLSLFVFPALERLLLSGGH